MKDMKELMRETAETMGAVPLAVTPDNVSCAETDGATFFYSSSFMNEIEAAGGEDGVRFVLAHEMGHQVGGMDNGGHEGEFMADEFATRALAQMGADFESIQGVFAKLEGMRSEESPTHPMPRSRLTRSQQIFQQEKRNGVGMDEVMLEDDTRKHNPNVKDLSL